MELQIEKYGTFRLSLFLRRSDMQPSMVCPTCKAAFAGHVQGMTFYKCEGKAFFDNTGLNYICKASKVKYGMIEKGGKGIIIICEACQKKHHIEDNCCIKIQCPCGNQIKTCSS